MISHAASAQLVTNNADITVSAAAQVTVNGGVMNQASATIANNGTIYVSGDWTNDAGNNCFGTSTGTVILNGGNQAVGGTSVTAFNNLTLQGTGIKTLMQDQLTGGMIATPSGVLQVGNVVLDLNGFTMNITNKATAAISASAGYILSERVDNSSMLRWTIGSVPGVHTIPFGNAAGVAVPFSFNLISGDAGIVTVSTYPTAPNNTPYPVTPVAVTNMLHVSGSNNAANVVDRFWQVETTGSPVASLTFTYAAAENAVNGNTAVRAQRYNAPATGWELPLPGQLNPTSQSVMVSNVSSFGPWALSLDAAPLPVELLVFDAQLNKNNVVDLFWSTAAEINNDYFTIERTSDLKSYETVATVDGEGNSSAVLHYKSEDRHPLEGISYYRLKQTDFDGKFSFSELKQINLDKKAASPFSVYPNPARDYFYIRFSEVDEVNFFLMTDISGKTIRKISMDTEEVIPGGGIKVSRDQLASGVYFIIASTGASHKLVLVEQ